MYVLLRLLLLLHIRPHHTLLKHHALCQQADDEAAAEKDPFAWKIRRGWQASDGTSHIGSSLDNIIKHRPFPGVCVRVLTG